MTRIKLIFSYPGFWLFALAAAWVAIRGQATREMLSLLAGTSLGVGELMVGISAVVNGSKFTAALPRLLNALGALLLAGSVFVEHTDVVASIGSVVFTVGLILWARQLRRADRGGARDGG